MSKRDDGGPAFPGQQPTGYDPRSGNFNEGMALRDYFAASLLGKIPMNITSTGCIVDGALIAKAVYEMADHMLAVRDQ